LISDSARPGTADKAVGLNILTNIHNAWGTKPVAPDLNALWRDLG
jgi:hypothetical protein